MSRNRRDFIKKVGLTTIGITSITSSNAFYILKKGNMKKDIIGHGDFRYKIDRNWSKANPEKNPVKNCHEMVMDRKKRLIMTTDEVKNNILIYNKSGKLLDSWTVNLDSAHGLTLHDEGGDEMLYITNATSNGGKVIKTDLNGKIIHTFKTPHELGIYKEGNNYAPTETIIASNGDVYIADGYGSQYIIQYNHKGEYIRHFGGSGNEDDKFSTVHGLAIDDRDKNNPILMCTSRAHNSFKKYTLDGKYIETIFLPGAFVCRPVIDGENLYSGVCWSRLKYLNQTDNSGFITILDKNNKVVSNPGGTAPTYNKAGELELMVQKEPIFNHCHDVCIDDDKDMYVCQWNANKTYPIKLTRV